MANEDNAIWAEASGKSVGDGRDAKNANTLVTGQGELGNISMSDLGTIINNPDVYGPEAVEAAKRRRSEMEAEAKAADLQGNYTLNDEAGFDPNAFQYGGREGASEEEYQRLIGQSGKYGYRGDVYEGIASDYRDQGNDAYDNAMMADQRSARAWEDQGLSLNEEEARGEQLGSTSLAREAAMGLAPSQAQYQLQAGLDRASAEQQSLAGGARGLGALSSAQNNAAAATAMMQQQTANESGRLRAQEMAEARGLYGSLSGNLRQSDQGRLQMGNQMSQYNAGLNEQYGGRMGNLYGQAGTLGMQAGQNALGNANLERGYSQDAIGVRNTQGQMGMQGQNVRQTAFENHQGRKLNQAQYGAGAAERQGIRDDAEDARKAEGYIGAAAKGAEAVFGGLSSSKPKDP